MPVGGSPAAKIENIARALPPAVQDEFRTLMNDIILTNLTAQAPGGNLITAGGPKAGSSAPPVGVSVAVSGANGVFTLAIQKPSTNATQTIYVEISYSPLKNFTQSVTTMAATTASTATVADPGSTYFFRWRSSFDRVTWSAYQLASTSAISAGLVESSAVSAGAAFNQTNYLVVNSAAVGSTAEVSINGSAGNLTSGIAVKGTVESIRPSATIVGVVPSSMQFVGWDGSEYQLKPTLASVLSDDLEPVGAVSVVSTAAPTLPTITPIVSGGGIVGYNVTDGGAGASQPYTLTITDPGGTGAGATTGAQTIVAGVLISVAPGNAGANYDNNTIVTPTGGTGGGGTGGGTATGGNGGRMTAV